MALLQVASVGSGEVQASAVAAARFALETEILELNGLLGRLDAQIEHSLGLFVQCQGRIVVTGIGKPGHIGVKISATFSSTGTPSFFLHATEALHGDSGVLVGWVTVGGYPCWYSGGRERGE